MKDYLLALDLGTSSVGYVVFLLDDKQEPKGVIDLGVRVFPDGREPKTGIPLAVARREARGTRRTRDRGQNRIRRLVSELIQCQLLPADDEERKLIFQSVCPYQARANAANEQVEPYILGRALFHLGRRRGFKSNRLSDTAEETEYKQKISALQKCLNQQTLGQYLYAKLQENHSLAKNSTPLKQKPVRFRNGETEFYADRAMYQSEFNQIKATQDNKLLTNEQWDMLEETIFFQYPLKPVARGKCRFFPEETRAHIALPISHEYRILQEVNNLKYVSQGVEFELQERQKKAIYHTLKKQKTLAFTAIKKLKDEHKTPYFPSDAEFNLDIDSRANKLLGNETLIDIRKPELLGKLADTMGSDALNDFLEYLIEPKKEVAGKEVIISDTELVDYIKSQQPSLSEQQISNIAGYKFKRGTAGVSRKFMQKINAIMLEKGCIYSDAVTQITDDNNQPLHHSHFVLNELMPELPYYGEAMPESVWGEQPEADKNKLPDQRDNSAYEYGKIANPSVHIALNQLRVVVNRIIKKQGGAPQKIHIELTRDLKNSKKARDEIAKKNAANKKNNDRIRKKLAEEFNIDRPSREDIQKIKLWEELDDHYCIFTEQKISAHQLFSEVDIEHIVPFSRCRDDSINNKTLAFKAGNQEKANRTPFEAFANDTARYSVMMKRALKSFGQGAKYERFKEGAFEKFYGGDQGDMIARQINDTKYLSKKAKQYLSCICDVKNIVSVNGQITAILRDVWQLNNYKNRAEGNYREDHRHHIVDAFVVGLTSRSLIQRINTINSKDNRHINNMYQLLKDRLGKQSNIPTLKQELMTQLQDVIASYKPDRSNYGSMCNDTAYAIVELEGQQYGITRKATSSLTYSEIFHIRDEHLKTQLLNFITNNQGANDSKELKKILTEKQLKNNLTNFADKTGIKKLRILVLNQSIKQVASAPYKGYALNSYAYCDVWQIPKKKDKKTGNYTYKYQGVFVPYAEVNEFKNTPKRPTDKNGKSHPAAKRLMRLYKDDNIDLIDKSTGEVIVKRIAGFSAFENKLDIRDNLKAINDGQNFKSINTIFDKCLVKKRKN